MKEIVSSIDIGTNTVTLLIAEVNQTKLKSLYQSEHITSLGEGLVKNKQIKLESIKKCIEICHPGGLIILMSNISSNVHIPAEIFSSILRKEITLKGSWNSSFNHSQKNDWKETIKLFNSGFKPSDFVSHRIKLEEVPETLNKFHLHKMRKKQFKAVKALIEF